MSKPMWRDGREARKVWGLLALLLGLLAPTAHAKGVKEWLCSALGMRRCASAASSLLNRGAEGESAAEGTRIAKFTASGQETVLWNDCGGCWSIANVPGGLAVARKDGIWLIPEDGKPPRRVAAVSGVELLLGSSEGDADRLLLIRAPSARSQCYRVQWLDLSTGILQRAREAPQCLTASELKELPIPDRIRDGQELTTTRIRGQLRIQTRAGPRASEVLVQPRLQDDEVDRWGALWVVGTPEIAFLSSEAKK